MQDYQIAVSYTLTAVSELTCPGYFIYQFTMPRTKNKHIPELIKSAKEQFDNFSEAETQEVFITIREAKSRGLLRKQPADRCLNQYVNAANYLLRIYSTDELTEALTRSIDNLYVYIALVATNSITTTAWRAPHDSAAETPFIEKGESRDESSDKWRFKEEISLVAIYVS